MWCALLAAFIFAGLSPHCLCHKVCEENTVLELAASEHHQCSDHPCSPIHQNCKTSDNGCNATNCVDIALADVPLAQKTNCDDAQTENFCERIFISIIFTQSSILAPAIQLTPPRRQVMQLNI